MGEFPVILPWDDSRITYQPGLARRRCSAWRSGGACDQRARNEGIFARTRDQERGGPAALDPRVLFRRERAAVDGGVGGRDWAGRYLQCGAAAKAAELRRLVDPADRAGAGDGDTGGERWTFDPHH